MEDERGELDVPVDVEGSSAIIRPDGELDIATVSLLERALERAAKLTNGRVVLDLQGLGFMDCSGLEAILRAREALGERFILRAGTRRVHRVIELAQLEEPLPFEGGSGA